MGRYGLGRYGLDRNGLDLYGLDRYGFALRLRVLCIFVLCLTILKKIRHRREGVYWQQRTRAARPIRAPIHECKDVWPPQRLVERSGSLGLRRKLR